MTRPYIELRIRVLKGRVARVAAALALVALGCAILVVLFPSLLLNSYVGRKIEHAFAAAHPGQALRLGSMDYSWRKDCFTADSVRITTPDSSFTSGPISVCQVRWAGFVRRRLPLSQIFAQATFSATNLALEFSSPRYKLHCARIEASVPAASLSAEAISLWPQLIDEAFFAAHPYRMTRFGVTIPTCRVAGVSYSELLSGTAYRAQRIEVSGPKLDALVDREKPADPHAPRPKMIRGALLSLGKPIAVDLLVITNGTVKYGERRGAGGPAGVVTLGAMQIAAKGLVSPAPAHAAMKIEAETSLMNAAKLTVSFSVPLNTPDLALSYSGSLGPMDLTRLNAFLEVAERIRITSGRAERVDFTVQAKGGRATGSVQPIYAGLDIAYRDAQTGSEQGVVSRTKSFVANTFKLREANLPDPSGSIRAGKVKYQRKPDDTLLKFIWYALRSGLLDGIRV